ncbi:hypothetical protein B0H13DRAFT_2305737 [Mycena leptocephala]|nr:hypothetical protein B0H13DRAFT_2305737 [Mycena leptocephala]
MWLGSSTRQHTGAAWHDIINFVVDAWNMRKVLGQAELLTAERLDALRLFELHMAVLEDLSRQHATEVVGWSQLKQMTTKSARGSPQSVYQHKSTEGITIESVLASLRQQFLVVALLESHREHPLEDTWETITKLRDSLNSDLKKFRERQCTIYPRLKLSGIDVDELEVMAIQLPSYRMKHGQRAATAAGASAEDAELRDTEIQLQCGEANSGILAVRAASLALSAVKKARDLDYRGQAGMTRSQRNLQKAELMKTFEITITSYLAVSKPSRKETHLHRAKGDSRLFDETAWYLQSGVTISRAAVTAVASPNNVADDGEDDEPQLLAGTQTLKRSGFSRSQRAPKCLKDIAPDDVIVESSSSSEAEDSDLEMSLKQRGKRRQREKKMQKAKRSDGWVWLENLMRGQKLGDDKLVDYKRESDRVQWFRAEAEMYRWLEAYERKHAKLFRVIERFHRDSVVWVRRAVREEQQTGGGNGKSTFARKQAAMFKRLEHNAKVHFKNPEPGAHHDWVSATTFDELVTKIDGWRDLVFNWMGGMGVYRAYKDF